jgi:hypothetical protein
MPANRLLLLACTLLLPVQAAHAEDVKVPIRGLVSMGAYRFVGSGGDPVNTLEPLNAKPGIFGGLVVIASWKQLQPTPNSQIGDGNVIDQALAEVRAYNERNPERPLGVKLRVWGGFEAPEWAKQLGGPPIDTVHNGKVRTVGRFWGPLYRLGNRMCFKHPRSSFRPSGLLGPREPEPSIHRPMFVAEDCAKFVRSVVTGPRLGASPANSAFTRVCDALWPRSLGRGDIPRAIALPGRGGNRICLMIGNQMRVCVMAITLGAINIH